MVSEKKIFEYFLKIYPFILPRQPIKLCDLVISRVKHGGLLLHFCKKKYSNIPNDSAEIVNFHFFHRKVADVADDITHHELSFLLETPKLFFNRILMYFEH